MEAARNSLAELMNRTGKKQGAVARALGVSSATVSLFLKGTYSGDNDEMAAKVHQYVTMERTRAAVSKVPDVSLNVGNTRIILEKLAIAHAHGSNVLIHGPAGCGKTTSLKYYFKHNYGVVYVEADVSTNTPGNILKAILRAMGMPPHRGVADCMAAILRKLEGTHWLLIIDEAQHLTEKAFDAVRAINDKTGVGIVYAGNPTVLKRMRGRHDVELDQLYSRLDYVVILGNHHKKVDIRNMYAQQNLSLDCIDYLYNASHRRGGLRLMSHQCQLAQNIAAALGEDMTIGHLEVAASRMGILKGDA